MFSRPRRKISCSVFSSSITLWAVFLKGTLHCGNQFCNLVDLNRSSFFWVLLPWRSLFSQGPWRSLDMWQRNAVQLPQRPSHFSRLPKWFSQCCFLVIFKTQGVRSQSSILCRGRLKMRGRMSIIRTLQKEFVSSRIWVHSLKFLKGISDLISEAN